MDFSNANPDVQDVNTLLQKLLDKFYPKESQPLIPLLSADNGKCTASSVHSSGYETWKAFDGNNSTVWASANSSIAWLQYDLVNRYVITRFILNADSNAISSCMVRLQGSNDSLEWTDLSYDISYGPSVNIDIPIDDVNSYRYVRAYFTGGTTSGNADTHNTRTMQVYGY